MTAMETFFVDICLTPSGTVGYHFLFYIILIFLIVIILLKIKI